ncbi:hypothetical protein A2U01_0096931, partial [Trifolium medium]|nr:hypothetical protein [Trifolium medium]
TLFCVLVATSPGDVLARCVASRRQPSPVLVFLPDLSSLPVARRD